MAVPESVLTAFGASGNTLTLLPGGQGRSVLCNNQIVFKPTTNPVEAEWAARVLTALAARTSNTFRIPKQLRSLSNGKFFFDGWTASEYLPGTITSPLKDRWTAHLATVRAFNAALKELELPRPDFLDAKHDPWTLADRVAWGEQSAKSMSILSPLQPTYHELLLLRRDGFVFTQEPQVIHGDMSGNVLFPDSTDSTKLPAVIDFSPYFRPAAFAEAMVIADFFVDRGVVTGEDWPRFVKDCGFHTLEGWQLLVRAVLFRLVAIGEVGRGREVSLLEKERREVAANCARAAIHELEG